MPELALVNFRESFDDAQRAFLDAGEREVVATQSILTVSQISISDIIDAADAGVTRGAFTHQWPRRSDFEDDFLLYLAEGIRLRSADRVKDVLADVIGHAAELPPLEDLVHAAASSVVHSIAGSSDLPVIVALWSVSATNEAVRASLAHQLVRPLEAAAAGARNISLAPEARSRLHRVGLDDVDHHDDLCGSADRRRN